MLLNAIAVIFAVMPNSLLGNHSQLRTMASVTVGPIDWPLPATLYWAELPDRHWRSTNARRKSECLGR